MKKLLLLCLLVYAVAGMALATDWYVATNGAAVTCPTNPAVTGTSRCSLAQALCDVGGGCGSGVKPSPGTRIMLAAGTYDSSTPSPSFNASFNCTATQPCWIQAEHIGDYVAIDCNKTLQGYGGVGPCAGNALGNGNYVYWRDIIFEFDDVTHPRTSPGTENVCDWAPFCNQAFELSSTGGALVNNIIMDGNNAILGSNSWACASWTYGNIIVDTGYIDGASCPNGSNCRGHGHHHYMENGQNNASLLNEGCRAKYEYDRNRNSYDYGYQLYSAGDQSIGFQTIENSVSACSGHRSLACPGCTSDGAGWPSGSCGYVRDYLFGTQGSLSTWCDVTGGSNTPPGKSSSVKDAFDGIVDNSIGICGKCNLVSENGYTKGSCGFHLTNNSFFVLIASGNSQNAADFTVNGTKGTESGWHQDASITGNLFVQPTPVPNGSGGPQPLFTAANWPGNTWQSTTGTTSQIIYNQNKWEIGRGSALWLDWHHDTTTNIDLCQMNGYVGEQYQVMNWMDPVPHKNGGSGTFTGTQVATGTIASCPALISVPISAPTIRHSAGDHTTVSDPPDTGINWFTEYDLWPNYPAIALGGTNTPTVSNTPTFTNTGTPAATSTNTPTLTPSNTPQATNTPTLTPTNTVTNTPTFTPSNTPTNTPTATVTPSGINATQFSVSQCIAMPPMGITPSLAAPGGFYASSTVADNGDLVCKFNVPSDGLYRVWVNLSATAFNADSHFIEVDGDNGFNSLTPTFTPGAQTPTPTPLPNPGHVFDDLEQKQPCNDPTGGNNVCNYSTQGWPSNGFVWNELNDRLATCGSCSGTFTERDLNLTVAGNPHTIALRAREATGGESGRVSYFALTTCLTCGPPNVGTPIPTPTPGGVSCQAICNHRAINVKCPFFVSSSTQFIPCPFKP